jgi:hypothetical protein
MAPQPRRPLNLPIPLTFALLFCKHLLGKVLNVLGIRLIFFPPTLNKFFFFNFAERLLNIEQEYENEIRKTRAFIGQLLWRPDPFSWKFHKRGNNSYCVVSGREHVICPISLQHQSAWL